MAPFTGQAQPAGQPFLLLPGGFPPDALGFALRTTLAVLLAYLVSFWLQLDSASSSGICVAIVAQATPGMALSKAFWRMGGTVLGGVVSLGVVAAFGQDRTMLLWAFCAWLGLCTAVASLLRDFRAYGAVLAGYTVGIIAVSDIDTPSRAFDSAVNRGAAIMVGILCVAAVNGLFAPAGAWNALTGRLREQFDALMALVLRALGGEAALVEGELSQESCARLGATILAGRTEAGYVAAELLDGRMRAAGACSAIAAMLAMLSAAHVLARLLPSPPADPALRARLAEAARTLAAPSGPPLPPAAPPVGPLPLGPPPVPAAANAPAPAATPLAATPPAAPASAAPASAVMTPEAALLLAHLDDLLASHAHAVAGLRTLADGGPPERWVRLAEHHDLVGAGLNATRTVIATGLGATFCIYSGWSDSTQMLVQQAAFTALLGMQANPTLGGVNMGLALPLPVLAAAIIKFGLLPQVSGFVPFSLALAPFVFGFSLLARHPRTAGPGGSMVLFLLLVLAPENPQDYDLGAFLNTSAAQVVAVVFMVLAFRLILPVSPRRRLYRVAAAVLGDLRGRLRARAAHPRAAHTGTIGAAQAGPSPGRALQGNFCGDPVRRLVLHYDRLAQAVQWLGRPSPSRRKVLSRLYALAELDVALCRAQDGLAAAGAATAANRAAPAPIPDAEAVAAIAAAESALAAPMPDALASAAARLLAVPAGGSPALLRAAAGMQGAARQMAAQHRLLRRLGLVAP